MGIRRFHLAFISISVVLAVFMASWVIGHRPRAPHRGISVHRACSRAGWRRADRVRRGVPAQDQDTVMRRLIFTLAVVAVPRAALACPVCFGQYDLPMVLATNAGVIAMLGVVVAVLASFASFFIYLARRARFAAETKRPRPQD